MGALPSRELWGPENLPIYPLPVPATPGAGRPKRQFLMLIPVCDKYFYLTPGNDAWRPRNRLSTAGLDAADLDSVSPTIRTSLYLEMSDLMKSYYIVRNDERVSVTFGTSTEAKELETDVGVEAKSPAALFDMLVTNMAPFTFRSNEEMREIVGQDPRHLRLLPCAIAIGFCDDVEVPAPGEALSHPTTFHAAAAAGSQDEDLRKFYEARKVCAQRYTSSAAMEASVPMSQDLDAIQVSALNDLRGSLPLVELPDGCGSRGYVIGFLGARNMVEGIPSSPRALMEQTLRVWASPLVSIAKIQPALILSAQMICLQARRAGLLGDMMVSPQNELLSNEFTHLWLPGPHLVAARPLLPLLQHSNTSLFMHILTWTTMRHNWPVMRTMIKIASQIDHLLPSGFAPLRFRPKDNVDLDFWVDPLHVDAIVGTLLGLVRVIVSDDGVVHVGSDVPTAVTSAAGVHSPVMAWSTSLAAVNEVIMMERGLSRLDEASREHITNMHDAYRYLQNARREDTVVVDRKLFASYAIIKFTRPAVNGPWTQAYSVKQVAEFRNLVQTGSRFWAIGKGNVTATALCQFLDQPAPPMSPKEDEHHDGFTVTVHEAKDGSSAAYAVRQCTTISSIHRVQIWYPVPSPAAAAGNVKFIIEDRPFRFGPVDENHAAMNARPALSLVRAFHHMHPTEHYGKQFLAVDLTTRVVLVDDDDFMILSATSIAIVHFLPILFSDYPEVTTIFDAVQGDVVMVMFTASTDPTRDTATLLVLPRTSVRHIEKHLMRSGKLRPGEYLVLASSDQFVDEPFGFDGSSVTFSSVGSALPIDSTNSSSSTASTKAGGKSSSSSSSTQGISSSSSSSSFSAARSSLHSKTNSTCPDPSESDDVADVATTVNHFPQRNSWRRVYLAVHGSPVQLQEDGLPVSTVDNVDSDAFVDTR